MKKMRIGLWVVLGLCAGFTSCLVPPFSTLQDARLVGQGKVELTPFYTSIGSSNEGTTKHVQNDFGLQAIWGPFRFLDIGFRYEFLSHPDSGAPYDSSVDAHTIAGGIKFSLVKDYLALCLPVGFAFGEDIHPSDTWEFQPTILLTLPLAKALDFNLSAKALIPLQGESDTLYAVNLGLGIRPGGADFVLRPEAGILFNPNAEGSGFNFHFSLGLSFRIGK